MRLIIRLCSLIGLAAVGQNGYAEPKLSKFHYKDLLTAVLHLEEDFETLNNFGNRVSDVRAKDNFSLDTVRYEIDVEKCFGITGCIPQVTFVIDVEHHRHGIDRYQATIVPNTTLAAEQDSSASNFFTALLHTTSGLKRLNMFGNTVTGYSMKSSVGGESIEYFVVVEQCYAQAGCNGGATLTVTVDLSDVEVDGPLHYSAAVTPTTSRYVLGSGKAEENHLSFPICTSEADRNRTIELARAKARMSAENLCGSKVKLVGAADERLTCGAFNLSIIASVEATFECL